MKSPLLIVSLSLALLSANALAGDSTVDAAVGGAIGGATGAVIGKQVGGRDGAIVGAAIGGAVGTAVTTDERRPPLPAPVGVRVEPVPPRPAPYFCPPGQRKKGRC